MHPHATPPRICTIPDCGKPARQRSLCEMHAMRRWRSQHPRTTPKKRPGPPRQPTGLRFWSHVDNSGECWLWIGAHTRNGYGSAHAPGHGGKTLLAHRVAWELTYGPIPDGMNVCHNCPAGDRPDCVNPAHLFLGSQAENIHDMIGKQRQAPGAAKARVGRANGRAVLTESAIREIRARAASGHVNTSALAREYRVSDATINRIVERRSWAHAL